MKHLYWFLALTFFVSIACAQTPVTRARADQIAVDTNGMFILTYRNLQTDLSVIDSTVRALRDITLSPTAISNLVTTATANSLYDLILSVPDLAAVTPVFPPGSALTVHSLDVAGSATVHNLHVTGTITVGSDRVLGTVESMAASLFRPTNTLVVASGNVLPFRTDVGTLYYSPDCSPIGTGFRVMSTGLYQVSLSALVDAPVGTSDWSAWVCFTPVSGGSSSNSCAAVEIVDAPATYKAFNGTFTYPMSSGSVISARCHFVGPDGVTRSGAALSITRTAIKDATGATITDPLLGGW